MLITQHQIKYKHYFEVYLMGNPPLNDLGIEQWTVANDCQAHSPRAPEAGAALRAVQAPLVTWLSGPSVGLDCGTLQTDQCLPGCWTQ